MEVFGHRLRWYIEQYVKFRYYRGRGNTLTSEFKGLWQAATGGGIIILLVDRMFGILLPLWIIFIAWMIQTVIEILLGLLDRRKIKMWQIENEYLPRKQLSPWEEEKMDRLKDIQEKISPETAKKKYKTYLGN